MCIRAFFVLGLVLGCSISQAEEVVEISLSEIWALDMPGTRDVRELEFRPGSNHTEETVKQSFVHQIRRSLSNRPRDDGDTAGTVFVVTGVGREALQNALAVLKDESARLKSVSGNKPFSLVFYSYGCGRYVRLDEVRRTNHTIDIDYHFEAHNTRNMSSHFALIPLDNMPTGEIQVKVNQLPGKGPPIGQPAKPLDSLRVRQIVSDSFSFEVSNGPN
jgi:hypothetical protein